MTIKPVKSAGGCRLRDPKTFTLLPSITDTDADPVPVDVDDPHWYRAIQCGDLVVIDPAPAAVVKPVAPAAPALAAPASAPGDTSGASSSAAALSPPNKTV